MNTRLGASLINHDVVFHVSDKDQMNEIENSLSSAVPLYCMSIVTFSSLLFELLTKSLQGSWDCHCDEIHKSAFLLLPACFTSIPPALQAQTLASTPQRALQWIHSTVPTPRAPDPA